MSSFVVVGDDINVTVGGGSPIDITVLSDNIDVNIKDIQVTAIVSSLPSITARIETSVVPLGGWFGKWFG